MNRLKSDGVRETSTMAEFRYWLGYTLISSIVMSIAVYFFLDSVAV